MPPASAQSAAPARIQILAGEKRFDNRRHEQRQQNVPPNAVWLARPIRPAPPASFRLARTLPERQRIFREQAQAPTHADRHGPRSAHDVRSDAALPRSLRASDGTPASWPLRPSDSARSPSGPMISPPPFRSTNESTIVLRRSRLASAQIESRLLDERHKGRMKRQIVGNVVEGGREDQHASAARRASRPAAACHRSAAPRLAFFAGVHAQPPGRTSRLRTSLPGHGRMRLHRHRRAA